MKYTTNQRVRQINEEIYKQLLQIFYTKVKKLELRVIKITETETNNSASLVKVYYYLDENQDKKKIKTLLEENSGQIRHLVSKNTYLRHTPKLMFIYDDTPNKARRIQSLLEQ